MSLNRAVRALRLRTRRRPGVFSQQPYLATNLSYVLHERADSAAVQSVARDIDAHADRVARISSLPSIASVQGELSRPVDMWLVATLGAVPWYQAALQQISSASLPLRFIDTDIPITQPAAFFRGPATLMLDIPDDATVGVASVVLRHGGHDLHVIIDGAFAWPADRDRGLRAMERLIQRDVDQWMPQRALWSQPVEVILGDEIV